MQPNHTFEDPSRIWVGVIGKVFRRLWEVVDSVCRRGAISGNFAFIKAEREKQKHLTPKAFARRGGQAERSLNVQNRTQKIESRTLNVFLTRKRIECDLARYRF
jgi:hypothetical protein